MSDTNISDVDTTAYCEALEEFIDESNQIAGTVLATQDGLLVAQALRTRGIEPDSIAAMSASMLSLADALAGQAGKAYANKLISEAESSTLVVLHAGALILTVIGRPNVNIGLIFTAARRTAQRIDMLVQEMGIINGNEPVSDPEALVAKVRRDIEYMRIAKGAEL